MSPLIVREPVPVLAFAARPDPRRLRLFLGYEGRLLSEVVVDEQQPDLITVSVFYRNGVGQTEDHGGMPPVGRTTDAIEVELRRELGERTVFDGATGRTVRSFESARHDEGSAVGLDAADAGLCALWVF